MSTLEEAMKEMASQFATNSSKQTDNENNDTDIELDMDLLSRARAMCDAAKTLSTDESKEIGSMSDITKNKTSPLKSPKVQSPMKQKLSPNKASTENNDTDIELDMDLLSRARAMCDAAKTLSADENKETGSMSDITKNKTSPLKKKKASKTQLTNKINKNHQINDKGEDPMDHGLLARAKAMCAAAATLSGKDIDDDVKNQYQNIETDDVKTPPIIDGWRSIANTTVAVFNGSSLVTTRQDLRQKLRIGNKVMIDNQIFTIAKNNFCDKSFELTEDYYGESNLEAFLYKPSSQLRQLKNKEDVRIDRESDKVDNQSRRKVGKDEIKTNMSNSVHNIESKDQTNNYRGSDAQRRAYDRLRKHKDVVNVSKHVESETDLEEKLNAMQKDEEALYATRVQAMKRAKDKANREKREMLLKAQREEAEVEEKRLLMERQAKHLQQVTKERLFHAYKEKQKEKPIVQLKEETELEARANEEADLQSRPAVEAAMRERRKETQRRQRKFLNLAEKVVLDEVTLLETKIKKRRDEYREIVNIHKPFEGGNHGTNFIEKDDSVRSSDKQRRSRRLRSEANRPVSSGEEPERMAPGVPPSPQALFHRSPLHDGLETSQGRGVSAPESGIRKESNRIPTSYKEEASVDNDSFNNQMMHHVNSQTDEMLNIVLQKEDNMKESKRPVKKKENKIPKWRSRPPVEISQEYIPVKQQQDFSKLYNDDNERVITPPQEASAKAMKRRQEARNKAMIRGKTGIHGNGTQAVVDKAIENSDDITRQERKFTSGDALASLMEQLANQ